jgi:hypothetical protein
MSDVTLIFQCRVSFLAQRNFHKVEMVRVADRAVVGMVSGNNAPRGGVAFGVGQLHLEGRWSGAWQYVQR